MGSRPDLQSLLEAILGSDSVYFQPPENVKMVYPAIVYKRDYARSHFADNLPYQWTFRYQVTVIDPNPDSVITPKIIELPMSTYIRNFPADNLNHDVFDVYF